MTQDQNPPEQHDEDRARTEPESGITQDPSTNTSPPSNPPIDREDVERGKEKLERIVNW